MILAIELPPFEYIIFVVAMLIALIGKIIEFSRKVRQKSIEAQKEDERQFGAEPGEAPEPPRVEAPLPRIELPRRPPRPRREEAPAPVAPPPPIRVAPLPPPAPARRRHEHPVIRRLRAPHGARDAIVLAEVLGRPKALRRGR